MDAPETRAGDLDFNVGFGDGDFCIVYTGESDSKEHYIIEIREQKSSKLSSIRTLAMTSKTFQPNQKRLAFLYVDKKVPPAWRASPNPAGVSGEPQSGKQGRH